MIQQNRKDYFQRLIEEFFSKLAIFINEQKDKNSDLLEKRSIVYDALQLFQTELGVDQDDTAEILIKKIKNYSLIEQYAKLLQLKHEISDIKEIHQLHIALDLIEYLGIADNTYSWDRAILKEDILRLLDI